MRTIMLAAALTVAGPALAADLPMRSAPPPFVPPLPVFIWTGAYFGINAGYAFDHDTRFQTFDGAGGGTAVGTTRPAVVDVHSDGFTGGGQIGYNYQFGAGNGVVVGIEADAAYTDLGRTNAYLLGGATSVYHSDMDFLGTVRGRLGYAFDHVLVYGTGGFAYGDVSQSAFFYSSAANHLLNYTGSRSTIDTGYTYGGGIEYALPTGTFLNFLHSSAVTIKAEYLHYDLGSANQILSGTGNNGTATSSYGLRGRTDGDLARLGINYKF